MTLLTPRHQRQILSPLLVLPILVLGSILPAQAHHPFGMAEGTPLSPAIGFLSGLGHPVIGPDHALFLISIAFVGLHSLRRWLLPLLAVGLAGSAFSQVLHVAVLPGAFQVIVALSLVASGLVALRLLPAPLLMPLMFLHGLALGSQIVGSEPTSIAFYFIGLFISQALLLLAGCWLESVVKTSLTSKTRLSLALAWIGLGLALAWSAATTT